MSDQRDDRGDLPSASSMDRSYHCPGSTAACKGLSELPEESIAASGTAIHHALETGEDDHLEYTEKQIADKIRPMELREVDNWKAACNITGPVTVIREGGESGRFWIRNPHTLDLVASARPDVVYLSAPYAAVINYKTGFRRPTPSELSWQSKTEVIATWHETGRKDGPITNIRGAFLSSRISSHFDCTDYDLPDIIRTENEIAMISFRSSDPYAPRIPGPWCRYCKARGSVNCPESVVAATVHTDGVALVPGRGGVLKADELELALKVARMTPEKIGRAYRLKSIVEAVFGAMAARLRSMSEDQLAEAGYALGPGRPVRSVNDGALAFKRSLEVLTEEERLQCVDFSYTKAAELLAARTKISEEEAKTRVLAALGDSVTETESAKRLKPIPK